MNRRTFLILIIFIIFLGVIGFFLLTKNNKIPNINVEETTEPEFIPFSGLGTGGQALEDQTIQDSNQSISLGGRESFSDFDVEDSNLTQITSSAIVGYTLFSKIFTITEDPKELANESIVETYNFFQFGALKIGDTGEGVTALQIVLNRLSTETSLETTGTFDTATKNAVIAFQTSNNLTPDGIVGNGTKAKFNEVQGLSKNPQDFEPIVREEERFTVRYQDKSNGHIYDLGIDDKTFEKVSDTSFSAIHESFFGNNGNSVVVRYSNNDSITTYLGNIITLEDGSTILNGEFLAENIPFVSISSDGSKLVYFEEISRRTRGFVLDLATKASQTVFDSKFTEWLPQFNGPSLFSLTSRASALSLGYSYVYDATKKDVFSRGVGGFSGLTTNYNSAGTKVLYSTNNGGKFIETYVYDFNDETTLVLGIKTLAEKCTWTDISNLLCAVPRYIGPEDYPDAWYKGEIGFDDRMWSVNTENGLEKIVSNLRHGAIDKFDTVNPIYKDNILLLQNKYDFTLWSLDLRN